VENRYLRLVLMGLWVTACLVYAPDRSMAGQPGAVRSATPEAPVQRHRADDDSARMVRRAFALVRANGNLEEDLRVTIFRKDSGTTMIQLSPTTSGARGGTAIVRIKVGMICVEQFQ
jgi:hypothetical protein